MDEYEKTLRVAIVGFFTFCTVIAVAIACNSYIDTITCVEYVLNPITNREYCATRTTGDK